MLTAHLAWLHEHEEEPQGPRPEIWVYCEGGSAELDADGLDAHIRDVERHALRLRALRIQYAGMLQGAELVEEGVGDAVAHPARIAVGCPFWCDARTYSLAARSATAHVHAGLAHRTSDGLWISLRHSQFDRLPEIPLTLIAPAEDRTELRLSLAEAEQLREQLGELIVSGEACASRDFMSMDELLRSMGAQVVEDSRLSPSSSGYVLSDVAPGGQVWVAVPGGLRPDRRETMVRKLLADVPIGTSYAEQGGAGSTELPDTRTPLAVIPGTAA
jgi:hypothetical protein